MAWLALVLLATGCAPGSERSLRFATWGSLDEVALLKPLLAKFQQRTGVPVELIHVPDNYFQKLPVLAASGQMPDVVFLNNWNLPAYAAAGSLLPLDPFMDGQSAIHRPDFFAPTLEAMSYRQRLYAIPRDLSNLVVYLNLDRFAQRQVPLPAPSWTLADMRAKARALSSGEDFGLSFDKRPLFWMPFVWSQGGDMFDASLRHCTLDRPAAREALTFYRELRDRDHAAPGEMQAGNAPMAQLFSQGRVAMFVSGRWSVPGFRKSLKFRWDVVPFPRGASGSVVDVDASGWAIARSSRHAAEAWQLVSYLASRPSIEAFAAGGLIVPARKDVATSPAYLDPHQPPAGARAFVEAIATGRPMRTPPNWNEVAVELDQQLESFWAGEAAETSLTRTARRLDELLRQSP